MRILKRILISVLVIFLLLIVSSVVLVKYYEGEIKKVLVEEINKNLKTQILVLPDDISISVLKSFPQASLNFRNIKALDATSKSKKDTLFKAQEISLRFNIFDILKKKYTIKNISANELKIKLWIDNNGEDNFHFWKTDTATSGGAFALNLQKIKLNNSQLIYHDHRQKLLFSINLDDAVLNGNFAGDEIVSDAKLKTEINYFKLDTVNYSQNKKAEIKFDLTANTNREDYRFKNGEIDFSDLDLTFSGESVRAEKGFKSVYTIGGDKTDIETLMAVFPKSFQSKFSDYEFGGDVDFKAEIESYENTTLDLSFELNDSKITHKKSGVAFKNISAKANYNNKGSDKISVNEFQTQIKEGNLSGKFSVTNFDTPKLDANIQANLKLSEVYKLFGMDTIESIDGKIKVNAQFAGLLKEPKEYISEDFKSAKSSGEIGIENANIVLKNSTLKFTNLNGKILLNNSDLAIDSISGNALSSDFVVKGFFTNFLSYAFLDNQKLSVEASLKSKHLNFNELLSDKENESKKQTVYKLSLPENITMTLGVEVNDIVFRRFVASDAKGYIKLQDKKLSIEKATFNSMEGQVAATGEIDASHEDEILISIDAALKKLNVNQLFYQLEDFGQSTMQAKHVRGILNGNIQLVGVWSPQLDVDLDKMYAKADLEIDKGELIDFEPLQSLSEYISLDELKHIKFSSLKNQIEVKDRKTIIPSMELKSSAMNINLSGTHTFNNEIDYKIKLLMSEYLAKKAAKNKKQNEEEFEVEQDSHDRRTLFLSMTGTVDNPIIKYDKKSAIQKMKEDLKTEKQTLKTILKEEFNWFKKDTLKNSKEEEKKKDSKFIIKWDENEKEKQDNEKDDDF